MNVSRKLLLLGLGAFFAAAFLAWKALVYHDRLRNVPEAMKVWWVRYAWEEQWGFGSGGDYAGIIVYDMPNSVKTGLEGKALSWLNTMPPNSWQGMQGSYGGWRPTPVPMTYSWA